jgi:hypothetical protein
LDQHDTIQKAIYASTKEATIQPQQNPTSQSTAQIAEELLKVKEALPRSNDPSERLIR